MNDANSMPEGPRDQAQPIQPTPPADVTRGDQSAAVDGRHDLPAAGLRQPQPLGTALWLVKIIVQPILLVGGILLLIVLVGFAQWQGWLKSGLTSAQPGGEGEVGGPATTYICPMMCVAATTEPGRCPVCAMELVPASASSLNNDGRSVHVDPETRRILNIQTVPVQRRPQSLELRAVGELTYDESRLKTLSAYVDGRLEEMFASFTGVQVQRGQSLARVYSPRLYASQMELLSAARMRGEGSSASGTGAPTAAPLGLDRNRRLDLYDSARRRLSEMGMADDQIAALEASGQADSRLELVAPISGTVIEKLAVEGQYVKEGDPIYRLADLSQVWLMLKLFPEDAALIRLGQAVTAQVQSLPHRRFYGRVAFVLPNVDPATRTVDVRVVLDNPTGWLRVGDFARATIEVPMEVLEVADARNSAGQAGHSDPMLADRDRDMDRDMDIAAAVQPTGFQEIATHGSMADDFQALWVPVNAVLRVGSSSVLYVETEPGRFEIRWVELGPIVDRQVAVYSGVEEGEQVVIRGNYLLDSQMQLSGNPSLVDPSRAIAPDPWEDFQWTDEMLEAIEPLSAEDQQRVRQQKICPVAEMPLGSMGTPIPVEVEGQVVFICCEGCRTPLLEDPAKYLAVLTRAGVSEAQRDSDVMDDMGDAPRTVIPDLPPPGEIQLLEPAQPSGARQPEGFEPNVPAAGQRSAEEGSRRVVPQVPPPGVLQRIPDADAEQDPQAQLLNRAGRNGE